MIEIFFLGFIYDVLHKTYTTDVKFPKEEKDILLETKESIIFLGSDSNADLNSTKILKSFADYFESEVIPEIDKLSAGHFVLSVSEKKQVLKETLTQKGLLWNTLRNTLVTCSFEELQSELTRLILSVYPNRSSLLIQSARECDLKLKTEIRYTNREKFYVQFQIQKGLLGGIRIYANSALVDASWLGKVSSMKNI